MIDTHRFIVLLPRSQNPCIYYLKNIPGESQSKWKDGRLEWWKIGIREMVG